MKLQYFLAALLLSFTTGQKAYCQHDNAKAVNASPLTLQAPHEDPAKLSLEQKIEKQQMSMLWEVALNKSPEFQLMMKKLIPSGHRAKILKFIDAIVNNGLYTGIGSGNTIGPSFGAYGGDYSTPVLPDNQFHSIARLLKNPNIVENTKAIISSAEVHEFYNLIRSTLDHVVGHYRDYKLARKKLKNANDDFEDLKKMSVRISEKDPAEQIEFQYLLKKKQKELNEVGETITKFRKFLVELTSEEAVRNLNESITSEMASKDEETSVEHAQLEALFEAALQNSPDINFVLAKLAPSQDPSKLCTILMKQASSGGLALTEPHLEPDYPQISNPNKTPSYKLPSSGSKYGIKRIDGTMSDQSYSQKLSFNVFSQILGTSESNRAKKTNITQAEQIMLYNMLRNTGDKIIGHYREYKISRKKLFKAKIDSAPQNQIEQQEKQLVIYRQHLIDLAGQEAVDNLDQKLDAEFKGSAQP